MWEVSEALLLRKYFITLLLIYTYVSIYLRKKYIRLFISIRTFRKFLVKNLLELTAFLPLCLVSVTKTDHKGW